MVNHTIQAHRFQSISSPGSAPKEICLIGWTPPPVSWIKINSDGVVRSPDNDASSGGLARDSNGDWIFGYSRHIGRCSVLQAELWGAYDGLEIAWAKGFKNVILHMDSKLAVEALSNNPVHINANSGLISSITRLIQRDWQVTICHTYREGNRCADWMANYGFSLPLKRSFFKVMLSGIACLILEDLAGVSMPRLCRLA